MATYTTRVTKLYVICKQYGDAIPFWKAVQNEQSQNLVFANATSAKSWVDAQPPEKQKLYKVRVGQLIFSDRAE